MWNFLITNTYFSLQRELLRQKELQAQQLEEQRAQFKMKTQNLLQFSEHSPDSKPTKKKVELLHAQYPLIFSCN